MATFLRVVDHDGWLDRASIMVLKEIRNCSGVDYS